MYHSFYPNFLPMSHSFYPTYLPMYHSFYPSYLCITPFTLPIYVSLLLPYLPTYVLLFIRSSITILFFIHPRVSGTLLYADVHSHLVVYIFVFSPFSSSRIRTHDLTIIGLRRRRYRGAKAKKVALKAQFASISFSIDFVSF